MKDSSTGAPVMNYIDKFTLRDALRGLGEAEATRELESFASNHDLSDSDREELARTVEKMPEIRANLDELKRRCREHGVLYIDDGFCPICESEYHP